MLWLCSGFGCAFVVFLLVEAHHAVGVFFVPVCTAGLLYQFTIKYHKNIAMTALIYVDAVKTRKSQGPRKIVM